MPSQLELDLNTGGGPPGRRRGNWRSAAGRSRARLGLLGGRLIAWAPVWIPAALALQIAFLGLLPARAEARRLDRATGEVEGREAELADGAGELERERHMLSDDVYRERLRQSRTRGITGELFGTESTR